MNITEVRVRMLNRPGGRVKATAAATIDGNIVIHDIMITEGPEGVRICMPSRRCADGEYRDIVHPANRSARYVLSNAVTDEYYRTKRNFVRARMFRENARYGEPQ